MMNALTTSQHDFTPSQLATIKNTVARDANNVEFDLFMNMAKSYGLDPFRKQLHIIIYNKDKPDKRTHAIFPSRDGLRVIAQRCGDYRPASEKADIEYDETLKGPTNPLGIVSATVKLWKQDPKTREWFPVIGEAYWDEFVKLKEEWAYDQQASKRQPTGKETLNGNWATMPRVMITKCAEGQALRAGWPDQFGGLCLEEELASIERNAMRDVTPKEDISPSDAVAREQIHRRQNLIGDRGIMMVMDKTGVLERIKVGDVYDRCAEFIRENEPHDVYTWHIQNREALKDFWAYEKGDALELKKLIESKTASVGQADET